MNDIVKSAVNYSFQVHHPEIVEIICEPNTTRKDNKKFLNSNK